VPILFYLSERKKYEKTDDRGRRPIYPMGEES